MSALPSTPAMSGPLPLYRPDPNFREPFNADTIFSLLDRFLLSPTTLLVFPLIIAWHSKSVQGTPLVPATEDWFSYTAWRQVIGAANVWRYKVPIIIAAFVLFKTAHRALSRIVQNNGHYYGDKPDWNKEVVLVTGGANGIGKEIAVLLAERSKKPVAVLDLAPMSYTHPNIRYYNVSVADEEAMNEVAKQIRAEIGDPTIIVNNAGIAIGRTIINTPTDAMMRVMAVNTYAHIFAAKIFLPHMIKINHGHIVTVASSAAYVALPNLSTYAMSKAAVLAFHEVLRHELRARYNASNVRATIVCPTKVATMMGANMADHPNQFLTPTLLPETVARRIVGAIDKGLSEHLMMPGYTEILPLLRGIPSWMKRGIELAGHTDDSVTDASDERSRKIGYAYALPPQAVEDPNVKTSL